MSKFMMPGEKDLYEKGFVLEIEHVPTSTTTFKNSVKFSAFLDTFSDAYNSEWNAEQVFGRMDPIATFRQTRRAISVAWRIPSSGPEHAAENLWKINKLLTFLYPTYEERLGQGASTMNMGPLFRVKFGNLLQNVATGEGLLGYVNGFTFDPELEEGFYTYDGQGSPLKTGGIDYIPKTVRLNFELTVLHEHPLGFRKDSKRGDNVYRFRGGTEGNFPYKTGLRNPGDIANNTTKPTDPTPSESQGRNEPVSPSNAQADAILATPRSAGVVRPGGGGES